MRAMAAGRVARLETGKSVLYFGVWTVDRFGPKRHAGANLFGRGKRDFDYYRATRRKRMRSESCEASSIGRTTNAAIVRRSYCQASNWGQSSLHTER